MKTQGVEGHGMRDGREPYALAPCLPLILNRAWNCDRQANLEPLKEAAAEVAMSCMNHSRGGGGLRASGAANQGGCFRISKPGKQFAELPEVPRLFPVGNASGIRFPLWMCSDRKPVTKARPIAVTPSRFGTCVCDISAERFVTTKQQSAGSNRNEEVVSFASWSHAPKLRLGETHVPLDFLPRREKTLPVVGKIRYARH
jgi:hypothetical protein